MTRHRIYNLCVLVLQFGFAYLFRSLNMPTMVNVANMNIGEAIKEMRASVGLSQKQLAEKATISQNALCNIEKGYSFPSKDTIKAICDAMDIPVSWLLFSSITEEDVPEEKREIFNALREPMMKVFEK